MAGGMTRAWLAPLAALVLSACGGGPAEGPAATRPDRAPAAGLVPVTPVRATDVLTHDPDDPSIWVNKTDPSRSLIIATMKAAAPDGGLAVFGLDGKLRQFLKGADRPNNVDVEYGLDLDATPTDIAVLTERLGRRLRVYSIARDGSGLRDISAGKMPILEGATGDEGAPMGIGLYRRPGGPVFAIIAPKAGPKSGYLWQYRLEDDGTGRVGARLVRRFGAFSGVGEIEAIAVDDELGYVYYADEAAGIHKWYADPDAPGADRELALFGRTGYQQDREGLGVYNLRNGAGYIISVDQLPGESVFHVYRRQGEPGRPHDHSAELLSFTGGADGTDGLDVTSASLGPEFPTGLFVAMNSAARNFLLFRWHDIAAAARPPLEEREPAPAPR
jgi:3-phytase